jgi:hypothetical protein
MADEAETVICGGGLVCEAFCVIKRDGRACPTLSEAFAAAICVLEG